MLLKMVESAYICLYWYGVTEDLHIASEMKLSGEFFHIDISANIKRKANPYV